VQTIHNARRIYPIASLVVLLSVQVFCGPPPTPQPASTIVKVYEDSNENGQLDLEESPISNVLVIAESNIHGGGSTMAILTDEDGQALITTVYTHYFNVRVIPPCGFLATTETEVSAEDQPRLYFGFRPETPRSGTAAVRFHLWIDRNEDGIQEANEAPLQGIELVVIPPPPDGSDLQGISKLVTDSHGWAALELGNSCDQVRALEPDGWETTSTTPTPIDSFKGGTSTDSDWLIFSYDLGTTEIDWGMRASQPKSPITPPTTP